MVDIFQKYQQKTNKKNSAGQMIENFLEKISQIKGSSKTYQEKNIRRLLKIIRRDKEKLDNSRKNANHKEIKRINQEM